MTWYDQFNITFWITTTTMIIWLAGIAIQYGYASICDNVEFCFGLIRINNRAV